MVWRANSELLNLLCRLRAFRYGVQLAAQRAR